MLISIEGIDASGKETQAAMLEKNLNSRGIRTELVSFPRYKTKLGQVILQNLTGKWNYISKDPEQEDNHESAMVRQSLFLADKCEWAGNVGYTGDRIIILDRYVASGMVYGEYDGLDPEWLRLIHQVLPPVKLSIFLDISVEESFKRRPERQDRYEKDKKCLEFVRGAYLRLFQANCFNGWRTLDGSGTKEEVHQNIVNLINKVGR